MTDALFAFYFRVKATPALFIYRAEISIPICYATIGIFRIEDAAMQWWESKVTMHEQIAVIGIMIIL